MTKAESSRSCSANSGIDGERRARCSAQNCRARRRTTGPQRAVVRSTTVSPPTGRESTSRNEIFDMYNFVIQRSSAKLSQQPSVILLRNSAKAERVLVAMPHG
jgi:hypothetical protein